MFTPRVSKAVLLGLPRNNTCPCLAARETVLIRAAANLPRMEIDALKRLASIAEVSRYMSRWTVSRAPRSSMYRFPPAAASALMPQQPQAPVFSGETGASASKVLPSSVDRARQTRRCPSRQELFLLVVPEHATPRTRSLYIGSKITAAVQTACASHYIALRLEAVPVIAAPSVEHRRRVARPLGLSRRRAIPGNVNSMQSPECELRSSHDAQCDSALGTPIHANRLVKLTVSHGLLYIADVRGGRYHHTDR